MPEGLMTPPAPYDLTIIIPTYNERENIRPMILALESIAHDHGIDAGILVVDDESVDGTIDEVEALRGKYPNLMLLVRHHNHGLSQSLYEGICHVTSPYVQCIDCDFSHPPDRIPDMYRHMKEGGCDMVIGSRYVPGGRVHNWSAHRSLLSLGAAILGRLLIPHVTDSGSGFFGIRREILEGVPLTPRGFRMGFEILGKSRWRRVCEIPIVFKDREQGTSKMRAGIIRDYLVQWFQIVLFNLAAADPPVSRSWKAYLYQPFEKRAR